MKGLIFGMVIGAALIVAIIIGMSHALGFDLFGALSVPDGAGIEREAEAAGAKAAEEKRSELDAETDAKVAADSAVADEHAADLEQRHGADADAEAAALDDLHRRLHEHLQGRTGEGEGAVQREVITESDVDDLLGDLRERLLSGAGQHQD